LWQRLAKYFFIKPMKVKYSTANVFRKLELVCGSIAGLLDGVAKFFMLVELQVSMLPNSG